MDYSRIVREHRRKERYYKIHRSAAGNPATDPSIPPQNGSCPWRLFPRELRDEILRQAYGRRPNGRKLVLKNEIELYNEIESQGFSELAYQKPGIGYSVSLLSCMCINISLAILKALERATQHGGQLSELASAEIECLANPLSPLPAM